MSDGEAVALASEHFGLHGSVRRFATEKDDTFMLTTHDGERYTVKVANPSEPRSVLDFQIELVNHVNHNDPTLPVPENFRGLNGAYISDVLTSAGEKRMMRVMSFLPGTPRAKTTGNRQQREHTGELLAKLRHATATFSHPSDSRILAWDVSHLLNLLPLLSYVDDANHRQMLTYALRRFSAIEPLIKKGRYQVLHNDFNTSNILISDKQPEKVSGIIDFGDAVRTTVAVDVSTALMNQLTQPDASYSNDIFHEARDILRGYLRFADLSEEELELIPHLAMGRVATRALLTCWRSTLFPENSEYIMRNTAPGWGHLEWFLAHSMEEVSTLLLPSYQSSLRGTE
ncbi:serine kinase (plasmid) [Pantoea cypripedii]|uniref:Serine kinase n=1 Tax=Pantoea cypripedii TaxID=55209 RepID=A0A6B9G6T0_PANCY|nr:serine kinase [Pantoea cypripedii]